MLCILREGSLCKVVYFKSTRLRLEVLCLKKQNDCVLIVFACFLFISLDRVASRGEKVVRL